MFVKKRDWPLWLFVGVILAGCAAKPVQQLPEPAQKPVVSNPIPLLLRQAEMYLARDRLMSPASGNAYDRFQAVLMIDPGNPQAVSGLQQILIRYVELGRIALRKNDIGQARRMLASARKVDTDNVLLREFEQQLAGVEKAAQLQSAVDSTREFLLDRSDLAARSDALQQVLERVAKVLQDSDSSVLIVARSDAEGRFLYRTLRQAAMGQRIRGDIKIDNVPKIVLLPPIY